MRSRREEGVSRAEGEDPISIWDFSGQEAEHVPGSLTDDQPGGVKRSAPASLQSQEPWTQEAGTWIPLPVLGGTDGWVTSDQTVPFSVCPSASGGGF